MASLELEGSMGSDMDEEAVAPNAEEREPGGAVTDADISRAYMGRIPAQRPARTRRTLADHNATVQEALREGKAFWTKKAEEWVGLSALPEYSTTLNNMKAYQERLVTEMNAWFGCLISGGGNHVVCRYLTPDNTFNMQMVPYKTLKEFFSKYQVRMYTTKSLAAMVSYQEYRNWCLTHNWNYTSVADRPVLHESIKYQSKGENAGKPVQPKLETKMQSLIEIWYEHPDRRDYERKVQYPTLVA
jgi:hypothetical protein